MAAHEDESAAWPLARSYVVDESTARAMARAVFRVKHTQRQSVLPYAAMLFFVIIGWLVTDTAWWRWIAALLAVLILYPFAVLRGLTKQVSRERSSWDPAGDGVPTHHFDDPEPDDERRDHTVVGDWNAHGR